MPGSITAKKLGKRNSGAGTNASGMAKRKSTTGSSNHGRRTAIDNQISSSAIRKFG